jgi:AraC-like DNA-binding protein
MDALSNVLQSVRFDSAHFLSAEFSAPWQLHGDQDDAGSRPSRPGAERVVRLHFIVEGRCKVRLEDGDDVVEANAGDLVLLPHDDRHRIGSDRRDSGAVTRIVCGRLAYRDSAMRPLLEALPRMLRIPTGDGQAALLLHELLHMGARESAAPRPGVESTLARMAELMFVDALRRYAESLPPDGLGWLAAMRDVRVGRALALMHAEPGRAWTLGELARSVALSRSALADRFSRLVGEPPMQYLTRWRLARAARTLRTGAAIVHVAEHAGYDSDAAFSRAFKREFGLSPTSWRRREAGLPPDARAQSARMSLDRNTGFQ